jgi:hypothetical protein
VEGRREDPAVAPSEEMDRYYRPRVLELVLEQHRDAVPMEGPEFLDQTVVQFLCPFFDQGVNDCRPFLEESPGFIGYHGGRVWTSSIFAFPVDHGGGNAIRITFADGVRPVCIESRASIWLESCS